MALLNLAGPQAAQLGQQYRQGLRGLSRTLGPFGGGQITRGSRNLTTQFGSQLARLFAGVPSQAQDLLAKIAQGSIAFPVPQTSVTNANNTSTTPGGYSVPTSQQMQGLNTTLFGDKTTGSPGLIKLIGDLFSSTPTGTFGTGDIGGQF